MTDALPLTRASIIAAHEIIKPDIHRTPLLSSTHLSASTLSAASPILFKAENLQKVRRTDSPEYSRVLKFSAVAAAQGGAFKIRGASYSLSVLTPEERKRGVSTHSSGT